MTVEQARAAVTAAQQTLAELQQDLATRQASAQSLSTERATKAERRAQLEAAQLLDGHTQHAAELDELDSAIGQIDRQLRPWPAVEAELRRRITEAEQALETAERNRTIANYEAVLAQETQLKGQYNQLRNQLGDVVETMHNLHRDKAALWNALSGTGYGRGELGQPPAWMVWVGEGKQA
jgi:chromosome segregation ATPase